MAPKRASSPARRRSASPARAGSKHESAPAFQEELHRIFVLLKALSGDAIGEEPCSIEELPVENLKEVLKAINSRRAAGSGAAGARHIHAGAADFPFIDVDPSDTGLLNFEDFANRQRKLLQSTIRSFSDRRPAILVAISELEQLQRRWKVLEAMRSAETVQALQDALREAGEVFKKSDAELVSQCERLATLQAPFSVTLSTLSGEQHEVEVTRTQLVGVLRQKTGELLGLKPYRILLACSSAPLEPDDALLEACGITKPGMEIGVAFNAEDPWREMPFSRFLELMVEHEVASDGEIKSVQRRLLKNCLIEDQYVVRHSTQLQATIDLKKQKQAWKDAEESEEQQLRELTTSKPPDAAERSEVNASLKQHEGAIDQLQQADESDKKFADDWATKAERIKTAAMADLDRLMPVLERSMHELQNLTKEDVEDLRAMAKPPELIMHVMKALCILFQVPEPIKAADLPGYWTAGQKHLLQDRLIIDRMLNFDKDNIEPRIIKKLDYFVSNDELAPENVRRCSNMSAAMCRWIRSMHMYHHTAERVAPMKFMLRICEEHLQAVHEVIARRQRSLELLQVEAAKLRSQLEACGTADDAAAAKTAASEEAAADGLDKTKSEEAAAADSDVAKASASEEAAADGVDVAKADASEEAAADDSDAAKVGASEEAAADDADATTAGASE